MSKLTLPTLTWNSVRPRLDKALLMNRFRNLSELTAQISLPSRRTVKLKSHRPQLTNSRLVKSHEKKFLLTSKSPQVGAVFHKSTLKSSFKVWKMTQRWTCLLMRSVMVLLGVLQTLTKERDNERDIRMKIIGRSRMASRNKCPFHPRLRDL